MAQLGFDNASNNAIARLKQIMRDETTRPTLGLELHRSESQQWYVYESFRPCEMRLSQTALRTKNLALPPSKNELPPTSGYLIRNR